MSNEKIVRFVKHILFMSFVTFFALYLSVSAGYYDYKNSKKVALTNSQIKKFEKDISSGKNVDLKKYIESNNKSYQNKISKAGLELSKTTQKCVEIVIGESFKYLSKIIGD